MQGGKYILWLASGILSLCILIYSYDMLVGDGDGIIARFHLNPLSIALITISIALCVLGILSSRRVLSNISLSLLVTFLCLVVIEMSLPLLMPQATGVHHFLRVGKAYPYLSRDRVFFKNYQPNVQFHTQLSPKDGQRPIIAHHINSDGMRGPETPIKKSNEHRILLVGDSYIQSIQLSYEQTIGPQLQQHLPDSCTVLQHGFPSWSPLLEWNWVRQKGLSLTPDEVILFLFPNDFFSAQAKGLGDTSYWPFTDFDADGRPIGFHFPEETEIRRTPWTLLQQSWQKLRLVSIIRILWKQNRVKNALSTAMLPEILAMSGDTFATYYDQQLATALRDTPIPLDVLAIMRPLDKWDGQLRERSLKTLRLIGQMHKDLAKQEIPLRVCFIPFPWVFPKEGLVNKASTTNWPNHTFKHQGLIELVDTFCKDNNIPLLDLFTAFDNYEGDELLYLPYDMHWDSTGHKVAARAVADWLSSQE